MTANAADRLVQHYVDNCRRLPWRTPPGSPLPNVYQVWLSEVMLQQTTVAAVAPRFRRFLERWPSVEALAAAPEEAVLGEWAGLGYYARARNLIACAREVAARGGFPTTSGELRKLPGVGDYTSAAIAAIAFGEQAAAVDTNVTRVVARLHALGNPTKTEISTLTREMMERQQPGDFLQALMDLGATICTPRRPRCSECPVALDCRAAASGSPEDFPAKRVKAPRPHRHGIAYWTEGDNAVWLVRRPAKGLLGGMSALPSDDWAAAAPPLSPEPLGTVHHVFTHFSLDLHIIRADEPFGNGWWHPLSSLGNAGLPTLYRRAADVALQAAAEPPLFPATAA